MTNCTGLPAEQNVEAYLLGNLPEDEATRFEDHYFDCEVCLAQVESLQAARKVLQMPPRKPVKRPIPWPVRAGILGAIAATLVLGYLGFHSAYRPTQPNVAETPAAPLGKPASGAPGSSATPKTPTPAATPALLADLKLPVFHAPNLRGESGDPHYDAGMKAYAGQDCPAAMKSLVLVPAGDEDALAARFYANVCRMHDGDMAGAAKGLKSVADAGDSPQQEASLYYLAQIALTRNDQAAAQKYLVSTIALRGDFEKRARTELKSIRSAAGK
jgi:hypothetical protein